MPLARYAREHGLEMRFIEYMPIGADQWERDKVYFAHEILDQIERHVGPLVPASDYDPKAPAMDFDYLDGGGRVGIIASISRPFCQQLQPRSADRRRQAAQLPVRPRRGRHQAASCAAAPATRKSREMVRGNVSEKWEGHEINTARFIKPLRTMHAIGG